MALNLSLPPACCEADSRKEPEGTSSSLVRKGLGKRQGGSECTFPFQHFHTFSF